MKMGPYFRDWVHIQTFLTFCAKLLRLVNTYKKEFQISNKADMSVPLPTLRELSMRMILQKDLPWDTYPPLKEDFEALERLPGNYKVVKESERFLKKDEVVPSSELTPWEAEVGDMLKRNCRQLSRFSIAKVMSGNPLVLWNVKHYYGFISFETLLISDRIVLSLIHI